MPKTLSLLAVLKKIDTKGIKSLSDPQWNTFLASDTEPNEIQEKIKKLEGYEQQGADYDKTGDLIPEDNNAMIDRFKKKTGRAKGRESLKVKKSKIDVASFKKEFFNKKEEPVKKDTTGTSTLTNFKPSTPASPSEGKENKEETEGLKGIRDVLDDILKVLRLDFKGDRKEARDAKKAQLAADRKGTEDKLEKKKSGSGVGNAVKSMLSPFTSIWDKIINFLKWTLIGVLFNKVLKWFTNPANKKKVEAVGKFFKDFWPALATAAALFLTPLGALVKGMIGLLTAIIPKLVIAIAANPWAAAAVLGGLAIWGISKRIGGKDKGEGGKGEKPQEFASDTKPSTTSEFNGGGLVPTVEMAGGGLVPGYNKGGEVESDTSHFGTEGYRMGQRLPEQLYYNLDKYTSSYKTKDGEVVEEKDELLELSGAIGMPDLIEHQKQLVDSIRKIEGYEDINFMDVVQYPQDRGRLVGMPPETLYPIFNASDAWKASDAKRDAAIAMDEGRSFDPTKFGPQMGSFFGGGLVMGRYKTGGFVEEKAAQARQLATDYGNAAPGRELDPLVNFAMDQMKEMYGITNTVAGSVSDGAGGFRMQSQSELNEENNAKLPFGMKMTEDGQNIDWGRKAADQARMAADLMKDPKYAQRLKEVGKQYGYENLTAEQFGEIANQQADEMQFQINRMIPGTESHRLDVVANEINQSTSQKMAGGGLVQGFQGGGVVPGSGNKDTVPAMLTPGEFVMSKGAVNKYGKDTLKNMNSAVGSVGGAGPKGDTVPSMLTPGEFVVSAPAVQKFGVNTLESMNLKGGGNNKPELKVMANKGGLIKQYMENGGVVGSTPIGPVGTPNLTSTFRTVTLPPVKKQRQEMIPAKSSNEIPEFRIPIISSQRSMVLSSLGISDMFLLK